MQSVDANIYKRLLTLYPENEAEFAWTGVQQLIDRYRSRIRSRNYHMSETDAVLITYGNQVTRPGEKPLATLHHFLETYVRDRINSVHILPFHPYSSDDGFSVIDYKIVDPELGSWEDVGKISETYRIMFDGVINHVSRQSAWFKNYLADQPKCKDFFIDIGDDVDLSQVVRPRTSPLLTPFTDAHARTRHVWTTFSPDQVDLNYRNPRVLLAVLDALFHYIQRGAALIRLDAIAFVWKQPGTPCVHLAQTHELIQLIREVLHHVAPEVIIITETNVPHHENVSYFGSGDDEAQMVYNFALPPLVAFSIVTEDATQIRTWAGTLTLPSDKVCFFNFTASHDGIGLRPVSEILSSAEVQFLIDTAQTHGGLVSYRSDANGIVSPYEINCNYMDLLSADDDPDDMRCRRMMLSQAIVLAMPGVPGIYFHSLVGSRNFTKGVEETSVYRSINRERLRMMDLERELLSKTSIRAKIFNQYIRLLEIRKAETAFNPFGQFAFPDVGPCVFAIHRFGEKDRGDILALNNLSSKRQACRISNLMKLPVIDLISGIRFENCNPQLDPYQVMWLNSA